MNKILAILLVCSLSGQGIHILPMHTEEFDTTKIYIFDNVPINIDTTI